MKIFEVIDQPKVYISSIDDPKNEFVVNDLPAWAAENGIPFSRIRKVLDPNNKKLYGGSVRGYRFRLEGQILPKKIRKLIIPPKVYVSKIDDPENEFVVNDLPAWAEENGIPYQRIRDVLNPNNKVCYGTAVKGYRFRLEGQTLPKRSRYKDMPTVYISRVDDPKNEFTVNNLRVWAKENGIPYRSIRTVLNPNNKVHYGTAVKGYRFRHKDQVLPTISKMYNMYVSTVDEPDKEDFIPNIQIWAKDHNIPTSWIGAVSNPTDHMYGQVIKGKFRFRRPGNDPLPPLKRYKFNPEHNFPDFDETNPVHKEVYNRWRNIKGSRSLEKGNWDFKDLWQIFLNQNQRCALTGLPFSQGTLAGSPSEIKNIVNNRNFDALSVDRIDPSKPYDINNIQFLRWSVNYAKQNLQQNEFIDLCKDIANTRAQNRLLAEAKNPPIYLGYNLADPNTEVVIKDVSKWALENGFNNDVIYRVAKLSSSTYGNAIKNTKTGEIWRFRRLGDPPLPPYTGKFGRKLIPLRSLEVQGYDPTNPVHQVWFQAIDYLRYRGGAITFEQAWHIFHNVQGERCAYSGRPFLVGESWKPKSRSNRQSEEDKVGIRAKGNWAPSPDRRDSSKGYTADNVAFVCYIVNVAKSNLPEDLYFTMCDQVANFNKS